jgi:hypothetical protein
MSEPFKWTRAEHRRPAPPAPKKKASKKKKKEAKDADGD